MGDSPVVRHQTITSPGTDIALMTPRPFVLDAGTQQDDAVDMELAQRMLEVVAALPAGSVATYGAVAHRAGRPAPR